MGVVESGYPAGGGYPGKTRFLVRPRVQGPGVGVVLTMVEQGYDPSVAYEQGQG